MCFVLIHSVFLFFYFTFYVFGFCFRALAVILVCVCVFLFLFFYPIKLGFDDMLQFRFNQEMYASTK